MNIGATTAKRPIDHNIGEKPLVHSMFTEKYTAQKLPQNTLAGLPSQSQTTTVILNPNLNIKRLTESIPRSEFTEI